MDAPSGATSLGAGVLLGLALPVVVSVASDGLELFEPRGLGAALFTGILALAAAIFGGHRLFALGVLLGAAAYYPVALVWAVGHGMSLGG